MKIKYLLTLLFIFSNVLFAQNYRHIAYYSLFLEEDYEGILVLEQHKSGDLLGFMKSFGGYYWFKAVYEDPTQRSSTYIQKKSLEDQGVMESYMNFSEIVDPFYYTFQQSDDNQIVAFWSPEANAKINGFLSRGEIFSVATLTEEAWHAGTYIPVKNISSLELWAKNNGRTFCQWISSPLATNELNKELDARNLSQVMSDRGFSCDKYSNLIQ